MLCKHGRETAKTTERQRGWHGKGVLEDEGQCQMDHKERNVLEKVLLFRNFSASATQTCSKKLQQKVTVSFLKTEGCVLMVGTQGQVSCSQEQGVNQGLRPSLSFFFFPFPHLSPYGTSHFLLFYLFYWFPFPDYFPWLLFAEKHPLSLRDFSQDKYIIRKKKFLSVHSKFLKVRDA